MKKDFAFWEKRYLQRMDNPVRLNKDFHEKYLLADPKKDS